MDYVILALQAIAQLTQNPHLGGGGVKTADNVRLIGHLIQLIQGGQQMARELKKFAEQIAKMAETGQLPAERDFAAFTERLNAANSEIDAARERLKSRKPQQETPPV